MSAQLNNDEAMVFLEELIPFIAYELDITWDEAADLAIDVIKEAIKERQLISVMPSMGDH